MQDIDDIRTREVEAFLSFVATAETERAIKARSFHILGEYANEDFQNLSDRVTEGDATASIAFLGRDAESQAEAIEYVANEGHEITLHGHRHVKFTDLSYKTAHSDLSRGMDAIEEATGLTPSGFFAPFKGVSAGTVRAADELGLDWILGETDAEVPESITMVNSVYPHDSRLLERGMSPAETFEQLRSSVEDNNVFLFHPNLLEYYEAVTEFGEWIDDVQPVSVRQSIDTGDVGIVLDCLRPIQVE